MKPTDTADNTSPPNFPSKPLVAIGSCVAGKPVRYNGSHKRPHHHIGAMEKHLSFQPICPEVGIGLGVPRETIRLVDEQGDIRAKDSKTQTADYTDDLQTYADKQLAAYPTLAGYILVKGSPSCGLERVTRYNQEGTFMGSDLAGVYAQRLMDLDPLLPMEEDGRLHDHSLRESFISRVYVYHHWKEMLAQGITLDKLLRFYARHKYLVMAHSVPIYQEIGPLLAKTKKQDLEQSAHQTIKLIMNALTKVATRRSHTNVLQHIQGYLKNSLNSENKMALQQLITQYRDGIVPLIAPLTLLQHHFAQCPDPYIEDQVFMHPYPEELALRSYLN